MKFILMWGRNLTFPHQFVSSPNDRFWKQFPLLFWLATCLISRITIFILIYLWTLLFSFIDLWMASGTGTKLFPLLYLGGTLIYLGKHVSLSLLFHKFSEVFSFLYPSRWTFRIILTSSKQKKNSLEFLLGLCLKLEINLGRIVVFAILNLPIQEHGMSLHVLKYFFP